jgi:V8-like Glu-specific endopeptidase
MREMVRAGVLAAALTATALIAAAAPASAAQSAAGPGSGPVGSASGAAASSASSALSTAVDPSDAAAFWTPARLRGARALSVAPNGPSNGPALASPDTVAPGGVPPLDPAGATASTAFDPVAEPEAPGNRVSGAIFVALAGGEGVARCSGTSVSAGNRSLVVTAGHCVYDGGSHGRWIAGKWVFIPGYHDGERPYGVFPARWLGTTRPWRQDGSENGDVGAAVVGRNERGQLLADAVGAAGIAWGLPPEQSFDVHGYPVAPPYDGSSQRLCAATPYLGHDFGSFFWTGPLNLAVECPVTGGASGGGWLIDGATINSVTDYGYGEDSETDYGAYFGDAVRDLYKRAAKVK